MPGKYWYAAMSFVYGAGGEIAEHKDGKWVADLDSSQAAAGLTEWQKLATEYSVGGATLDESTQDAVMAQGHVAIDRRQRLGGRRGDRPEDRRPRAEDRRLPDARQGRQYTAADLPRRL